MVYITLNLFNSIMFVIEEFKVTLKSNLFISAGLLTIIKGLCTLKDNFCANKGNIY